jgi:hypothetical protein
MPGLLGKARLVHVRIIYVRLGKVKSAYVRIRLVRLFQIDKVRPG